MMRYYVGKELIVNSWLNDGFLNFFAVDADTGVRIVGTDGATEQDAAWFAEHWHHGAKREDTPPIAEPEQLMSGNVPYSVVTAWRKEGDV